MRQLTALVAQKTTLCDTSSDANTTGEDEHDHDHDDNNSAPNLESLVQPAAALLAICTGGRRLSRHARAHVRARRPRARATRERRAVEQRFWKRRRADVRVRVRARRNDSSGCLRNSGCTTATAPDGKNQDDPSLLCLVGERPAAIRVLELGAGTGLVSLTIGKTLETGHGCRDRSRRAEIVASDFYLLALDNLRLNIRRNFPFKRDPVPPGQDRLSISALFLNWEEDAAAADPTTRALGEHFDVLSDEELGANIVYKLEHAAWFNACLGRFLRLRVVFIL